MVKIELTEPDVAEKVQAHLRKIPLGQNGKAFTALRFSKEVSIHPIDTQADKQKISEYVAQARERGFTHVLVGEEEE